MSLSLPARQRCGVPKSLPLPRAGGDGSKLRSKRKATSKLWLLKARSLVSPWQLAQVGCATLLYEKDQRSLYVTQSGKGEENMQCPIKPSGMSCQMSTCGQSGQLEAFEHVGSSRFSFTVVGWITGLAPCQIFIGDISVSVMWTFQRLVLDIFKP